MKISAFEKNKKFRKLLSFLLIFSFLTYVAQTASAFPLGPLSVGPSENTPKEAGSAKFNSAILPRLKFQPISDAVISAGNLVEFKLQAVSPTANPVRFDIGELPDGAFLMDGQFRWQPPGDLEGEYKLAFHATDGVETIDQTITLFFLPASNPSRLAESVGEDMRIQPTKRSALVLPNDNGWIVVIPSSQGAKQSENKKSSNKDSPLKDEKGKEGTPDDLRVGSPGPTKIAPNVTVTPEDGTFVGFGGFFGPSSNLRNATPSPNPNGNNNENESPTPPNPGQAPNFDLGIRFFDRLGVNNGPIPAFNPIEHHTFQSVNILGGIGNVFGRAAAFGDLEGHNNADSSKNFQDIYVANPYRQIDLTGYSPAPATRNVFLANNAQPSGEITLTDRTLDFNAEMHAPTSALDMPQAVLLGDLNNDGLKDIFIPNLGRPNVLLKNQGAGLPFVDISSAAGIAETSEARAAVLADFNLDGDLDIYVANGSNSNRLYMNLGNGTFLNAAALLGLEGTGRTVGVVAFDADNDGDSDLYLLNLSGPNRFYKNLLKETSVLNFVEVAASAGLALSGTPSGVEIGDLDNDGDYDLFVSDLSAGGARLFRNDSSGGNIIFSDQTSKLTSALGGAAIPPASGAAFLDIDNQGLLDIYVLTENDENIMFGNNGNFNFSDITAQEVVAFPLFADSVATGDYNNDDKTDIFISSTPSLLYKNISQHSNHYLKILLKPTSVETNADGIGARVEVTRPDGVKLTQQIIGGTGRSQDSSVLLFGMESATRAESVKVFWPDVPGRTTVLLDSDPAVDLHADQTLVIGDNAAPEIMTLSDHFNVAEDVPSSFELATKDVNGNPVTLTFSVLSGTLASGNASVQKIVSDGVNTTWRFTFTPNETGDINVRFSASDGLAPVPGTHDVTISVLSQTAFNHPPFFADPLPQSISVTAGQAMGEIEILARDSDNISTGTLNASVAVTPNLAPGSRPFLEDLNNPPVIVSSDGKSRAMKLKWTPAADLSGTFETKIILDDGIGSAEEVLNIIVQQPTTAGDATAPTFVSSTPANGATVAELNTVEFLLSDNVNVDEAGTQITVTRNGVVLNATDFTRDHSIENKILLTLNSPQEGTYVFSVTPRDLAGNTGTLVLITITDAPAPPTLFRDQTLGQGGYFGAGALPVSQDSVAAVIGDYDNDENGVPSRSGAVNATEDLFILTTGNSANQLFRLPSPAGPYQDTTASAGLPSAAADSRSAVLADFNNDGAKDLFVVNVHGDQLFLGNGNGTFAPDSALAHGIQDDEEGNGALVGDVNNDGLLDLYVLNNGGPNSLYLNKFDGTTLSFENVSVSTGTAGGENENSIGGLFFDPNDDGNLDLYVVNANAPNHLFLNPGAPVSPGAPWVFTDAAEQIGLNEPLASAQILKAADVDGDTDLDLLLLSSNPLDIKLLLHDQDHTVTIDQASFPTFVSSSTAGINLAADITISTPEIRDAAFMDFDNDGDADLVIAATNGQSSQLLLYENNGAGHFSVRNSTGFSSEDRVIRSLVPADINQDGRLDLISIGSKSQIFLNQSVNENAYLQIMLKGAASNHLGLNTQVAVDPQGEGPQFSAVLVSGTGRGQASNVLHFGLGNLGVRPAVLDHVIASWPRGTITLVENDGHPGPFFSDQRLIISETNNSEPVFMNITVEPNPEIQAPSPGFENKLQLVDISLDGNGNVADGNGVHAGMVPFRQYVKIDFSLPQASPSSITLYTDNKNGDPDYQGSDNEHAAGLVGASDHTTVVPMLWKVYNGSDIPNVSEPGSFIGDVGGLEGLVQDKVQLHFNELSSVITREIVSNISGGRLGLFPPEEVAPRTLHPSNTIRVYLAADFSTPPSSGLWPAQDYTSSRITFELSVEET